MKEQMDGCVDGWMNERIGWMDGWMKELDGWMDE